MSSLFPARSLLLVFVVATFVVSTTPTEMRAQQATASTDSLSADEIQDLPLTVEARQRYVGSYSVSMPDPQQPPLQLRIFEREGTLMGEFMGNDPTRMLSQGNHVFRPEAATEFEATFTLVEGRAMGLDIASPMGPLKGKRVEAEGNGSATSGALFDELAALDTLIFNAAFVDCDAEKMNAHLASDIEFYHDIGGFREGKAVRDSFRELAAACSSGRGPRRQLEAGSLEVYPINNYGAVQTGSHRFIQPDDSPDIIAKFVHLWQKHEGSWRLTRVLSFDHRPETANP